MVGEFAAKTEEANGRDFTEAKASIFGLQIDDQLTHLRWETAPWGKILTALFAKQACHALLLKEPCLVVQGPFTGAGFFGAFGCRLAEEASQGTWRGSDRPRVQQQAPLSEKSGRNR